MGLLLFRLYIARRIFIENSSINIEFLNNRTREITAGAYLVSITEIASDCQKIGRHRNSVVYY